MEISVVLPCLNESETLGTCIKKAKKQIKNLSVKGEIIVADNGSSDGSIKIAKKLGAIVINVKNKGYGNVLRAGIKKSRGKFILIADSDDSYNLNDLPKFYKKINKGYDIVQGCRLPTGGGKITSGAMPITHRYIGNPFLSFMTKIFFGIKLNDVYCGFRMYKRSVYEKNFYFGSGHEYTVESAIKFYYSTKKYIEIPITLHKDKRTTSTSTLNTLTDGFKTLKFILLVGSQIPSLVISLIFMFISIKYFTKFDFTFMSHMDTNLLISVVSFFTAIQFIFFSLFKAVKVDCCLVLPPRIFIIFFNLS